MSGRRRAQVANRRKQRRLALLGGVATVGILTLAFVLVWSGDTSPKQSVAVSLTEFAFSPAPIVAPDGRVELTNDGAIVHDFLVPELGKGSSELAPGQSEVLDLSDQPSGTYLVICDLTGHREAGMETAITLGTPEASP
jgi:plastocyanin